MNEFEPRMGMQRDSRLYKVVKLVWTDLLSRCIEIYDGWENFNSLQLYSAV